MAQAGSKHLSSYIRAYKRKMQRRTSPLRAIRRFCRICAGAPRDVRDCTAEHCPLWPFRFGVKPETAAKRGENVTPREG